MTEFGGVEALVCGGDRSAVDAVLSDPRLVGPAERRTGLWLPVPDPNIVTAGTQPRYQVPEATTFDGGEANAERRRSQRRRPDRGFH